MVRVMTRAMLERIGYTVRAVSTPEAALAFFEVDGPAVDLLLTDVVMPVMNGKELRDRIAAIRPDIKTLFMSGYTANVIVQQGVLDEGVHFIQKPFSMNHLARMVRQALA
jgi:CheY-like chemotaxis protein